MATSDRFEFVNRGDELKFLRECLVEVKDRPALIVVRAPAGFGKSSLTDRLSETAGLVDRTFCVVDPSIRGRTGATQLYDGFFLQRIAEQLDALATSGAPWPTLSDFLRSRTWQNAKSKDPFDAISEAPSISHAYRLMFDYASRIFLFGRFSPSKLLRSDQAHAVAICTSYAETIVHAHRVVLVLREAHHIDLHSLRALLLWNERTPGPDIIFEYTSTNNRFEPEHQKLFLRAADRRGSVALLELVRLGRDHLEYLINQNVTRDFELTSDYYLAWDGDLRTIQEIKFLVGIGRSNANATEIEHAISNLHDTIAQHVAKLSGIEKIVLAIILSHTEAIERSTILRVFASIDERTGAMAVTKAIEALENVHTFISRSDGLLRIHNETVAVTLNDAALIKGAIALAERALRDYYATVVFATDNQNVGITEAVRQYFRLCARTKDVSGLAKAVEKLSEQIRHSQDQAIFVDIVASAIEADPRLYGRDHDELIDWAASLAYDTCDWARAESLLRLRQQQNSFSKVMRACALQEFGRHDEALSLLAEARAIDTRMVTSLATDLVEAMIIGCRGEHERSRESLMRLLKGRSHLESPLLGYAYRFFEVVDGFIESLPMLKASIEWFERHGFTKSRAYSQLPAAMFLARSGDIAAARALIEDAAAALAGQVHDHHIILNNRAAVELLADTPNYVSVCDELLLALRLVRDDFSELTVLNNLALGYAGAGDISAAVDCAEKCEAILRSHDFADTDIYWPVCFNISRVFAIAGDHVKSVAALSFPGEHHTKPRGDNKSYWAFRYGLSHEVEESCRFLASRPHHPLYLSHWLIDLEGLNLLRQGLLQ